MGSRRPAGAGSRDFPDVVADDLWVDRLFSDEEVEIVDSAPVVVQVPRRSRDLVRVLVRTYRGKREKTTAPDLRDRAPETVMSTLRDLGRVGLAGPAAASTRQRTPPLQRGRGWCGAASPERGSERRRAMGAGRQLEGCLT